MPKLQRVRAAFVLAVFALTLSACTPPARHNVHYSLLEPDPRPVPTRIVVMPLDVTVKEMSAGGVQEEVREWTDTATANVANALQEYAAQRDDLHLVQAPELEGEQGERVKEYVALYDVAAGTAFQMTKGGGEPWRHKVEHFDYTLGNGMTFLREHMDADAVMFVVGEDVVSSGGRKAAFVAAAMLGVAIPMGHSFLTVGVVDLNSGDILWLDYSVSAGGRDLRKPEDARLMVEDLLKRYPGLEAYQKTAAADGN